MTDLPATDNVEPARKGGRLERLAILGVIALLLAAVMAPQVFQHFYAEAATAVPIDPPKMKPFAGQQLRGLTLQLHNGDPNFPFDKLVDQIAETGANTVFMTMAGYQENASSSSIFIETRKVPGPETIEKLVKRARDRGLNVVFMPMVLLENPGEGEWRGMIKPAQPTKWWNDYEAFILFYAKLAQKSGVKVFMVGSELTTMEENYGTQWRNLIAKVRGEFGGLLTYSSNWDHYRPEDQHGPDWWDKLDLIGMTSYYDLVGDKNPSQQVLEDRWREIKGEILEWQKKYDRPLLFTEVGYPNQEGCAKHPWNYYGSTKPDPETQAKCFQAFFNVWKDELAVGGVCVWAWRYHPDDVGGKDDIGYCPVGKPCMQIIQDFFGSPGAAPRVATSQPTTTGPATTPAPTAPPAGPLATVPATQPR
jgi:hypothetical protein